MKSVVRSIKEKPTGVRHALVVLGAGAVLALGACATKVPERHRGTFVGRQGASSILVFDGPGVVERLAGAEPGFELTRRDSTLSARPVTAMSAVDEWPTAARPSLDRARRLYLRDRSRTILYFDTRGPQGGTGDYVGRPYP